jgi:hypothetical protein
VVETHRALRWRGWQGVTLGVLTVLVLALPTACVSGASEGSASATGTSAAASGSTANESEARKAYGQLPLAFVPNAGRTDPRVRFHAQAGGASFFFTPKEAVFSFTKGNQGTVLRLAFLGANAAARIEGRRPGSGRVNYLLGNDPSKWRTKLPTYEQVVYRELWPGIDLLVSGAAGAVKYEFLLASGAKVSDIRLAYRGADSLTLSPAGELLIGTPLGVLRDDRPRSHQLIGGKQVTVASSFALERGTNTYGFALGPHNSEQPLVIDPGLVYSTFLGGSGEDFGREIAIDANGSAYLTGTTSSSNFPTSAGAFQSALADGLDIFVTKLNANGSALAYSTYLGGSFGGDESFGIDVDGDGSAYVTGQTLATDFPVTPGAFQTFVAGGIPGDAFVTKVNAAGSALVYSSYLGGSGNEEGLGIAVDAAGSAYVTGQTGTELPGQVPFPTTPGAFQTAPADAFGGDGFVTKVNASGSALAYSSYLGGSGADRSFDIATDAAGNAYLTGVTASTNFPTTAGAFQTAFAGGFPGDAFVTKVNAAGSGLVYSSYLGGSGDDTGILGPSIAVDADGNAYLTGPPSSSNFPTTPGAFQPTLSGGGDAYVTKVNAAGSALVYSSFLGGSSIEAGIDIAVDANGSVHVTGGTGSSNFPTTAGAFQMMYGGSGDAFVTKVNASGSALTYSSYLGGCNGDTGMGIAVDTLGTVYVGGGTGSTDFPTSAGALQTTYGGSGDAFVTKLDVAPVAQPFVPDCTPATGTIIVRKATLPAGSSATFQFSGDAAGTIGDGQTIVVSGLAPRTYTSTEALTRGWSLIRITCDDSDSSGDVNTRTATFRVAANETVTCTFTNRQPPPSPAPGCGVVYSTYLGGSDNDGGSATFQPSGSIQTGTSASIAVDASGNAYVTGQTSSPDFPTTAGAIQPTSAAGASDVFVTKLNAAGSASVYSTYLGGRGREGLSAIAVDGDGAAYVSGTTDSTNFPTTAGAFQTASGGSDDVFVTKLNASGSALVYSSYVGGAAQDEGRAIAIGTDGSAYVAGDTSSANFPTTASAYQATYGGLIDAFAAKVNPSGSALTYASFVGGSSTDIGRGLAVDANGNAYLTGQTASTNFPTTAGASQPTSGGSTDVFVTKVNATGSVLAYSSYLGGSTFESGSAIAVGGDGAAYVTGFTLSPNFPTTPAAFQTTRGGLGADAFVTKVDASGNGLSYSTLLGGSGGENGQGIAVDAAGNAYVSGSTDSTNFPTTPNTSQIATGGSTDAFVTRVNASGNALAYSSYLGGSFPDGGSAIAVDAAGNAYVTGSTGGSFPTTSGAFQTAFGGGVLDAFVTKHKTVACGAQEPGTIVIRKSTAPSSDTTTSFAFTAGGGLSPGSFSLKNGESRTFANLVPQAGYSVAENTPTDWDLTSTCSDGSPVSNIEVEPGETVTCTLTNTKRGRAQVIKTVGGAPPSGSQSFCFELRSGASATSAGTILESQCAGVGNRGLIDFATKLVPGTPYALCELVMPGWMTTLGPPFYVVYNPSGDNSTVCTDFTVSAGATKTFAIDNKPPPGGLARTIGFWKNWASCAGSKGNQKPVLDQTLTAADPAGIVIGTLTLHAGDCLKAVRLLDKSTVDAGKKMASDPAFALAAQLLAAKLNIVAGAGSCPAAVTAINDGQTLLSSIHFNGVTHDKLSAAQATQANGLATTLDRYNNNLLC